MLSCHVRRVALLVRAATPQRALSSAAQMPSNEEQPAQLPSDNAAFGKKVTVKRRMLPADGLDMGHFVNHNPNGVDYSIVTGEGKKDLNKRKPRWLKGVPPNGEKYERLRDTVKELGLATVCQEAKCPNIGECWR
jgi:hypothetical protein